LKFCVPFLSLTGRRKVNNMLTTCYTSTCFLFQISPTRIFSSRFPTKRFHEFLIFSFTISPPSICQKTWVILPAVMTIRRLKKMFKQSANSYCSIMLQMPHAETCYRFRCCGREICCHVSEQELHSVEFVTRLQIDDECPRKRSHHWSILKGRPTALNCWYGLVGNTAPQDVSYALVIAVGGKYRQCSDFGHIYVRPVT
jgi:hypothetical protein